ncbi:type II toxin-antitoxin system death-on-curing family toxin [Blastococcus sp. VKM Ac-2987]|uniref:type II toxin-antitoxin system death-on-curing family toxin n=1 Tax=Blastococcus sp. VKM Ac-2987 TaxID=3004141 RepID=UPI0022AB6E1A|nr:type II toxin-antitoxin system death-on-curing family toxin [Blastococcus sp. VKM Ac-2987]MCZ2860008.1 type II toxin-antitoxin system death-on-curing family toxin [Blastococcus sp. VKM Ac-2987]
MIDLDLDDLLHIARRTLGEVEVRDIGLLESAAARPRATAFGEDAYPSIHDKAAALLHSLARNHPLVDGNKRLALAAAIAFYGVNGMRLTLSNDEAYELVMAVAAGQVDDVGLISERLAPGVEPWR